MSLKYRIDTMGCQMNERDSETIAGLLIEKGYEPASSGTDADVILINTCSVRDNADKRFFGLLGQIKKIKEAKPETVVAVCGCMMQQQIIVDTIKAKYGWVDIVFGTHNIEEFPRLLDSVRSENVKIVSIREEGGDIVEGLPSKRVFSFKAYVSIMQGCNNFCTYCIVPYTRGRERSRKPDDIVKEVVDLAKDGVKEVMLLGQNVNSYCGGTNGEVDFADLLVLIDSVPGIERIRFMTSHPKDLSDKLAETYRSLPHLCPSIHLPIQSGSSRILELMNRKYTKETYLKRIEKLRSVKPDIVITTDFIVGFPGETEEDFEETMDLIEKVRFDSAFTFIYSPRPGTPAASYKDAVPEEIKHRRFNRMVERLNAITLEKNRHYVGRTETVLIEGRSKTDQHTFSGRTAGGKLVNIAGITESDIGNIRDIMIDGVNTFSFTGKSKQV